MLHCGACGKFLSSVGAVSCSLCPVKYHRACLAITDKAHVSKDWVCPDCKKLVRKGDNTQTPVKGICDNTEPEIVMQPPSSRDITSGTQRPGGSVEVAKSTEIANIQAFMREFRECMEVMRNFRKEVVEEMRDFRKEMVRLRDSIPAMTERMDVFERRLEAVERSGGDSRVQELESTIEGLKRELNDRDQEALLSDLEIGHLPEEKGENVFHAVAVLATRLGVALDERDVMFAERVGAPPAEADGRPRRVVVRLARRQLCDDLLKAARVRRAGRASGGQPRVYINERLTRNNRQLFHRVREEARRLQWRYTWTRRGRIFARQADGAQVHLFRSGDDLTRVFGKRSPEPESADPKSPEK